MITREQVADLQPGDVVEIRRDDWPEGAFIRSPLWAGPHPIGKCLYVLEGHFGVRDEFGAPYAHVVGLTVVSRAPRPLYVNHPRTEPVSGDVVRDAANRGRPDVWMRGTGEDGKGIWLDYLGRVVDRGRLPVQLRLLVDGETGQVAP